MGNFLNYAENRKQMVAALDWLRLRVLHTLRPDLFPQYSDHEGSLPGPDITFQEDDLLPGAQDQLGLGDGHGQAGPLECGLQVGMAVAVVPGLLVAIIPAGWNEAVGPFPQVPAPARLKLDRPDGRRAAHAENLGDSGLNARFR